MFRTAWRAGDRDPKGARRDSAADLVFLGTAFRALVRRESLPGWLRAMAAGAGLLRGGAYAAGFWRLRVFSALHTWGNKAAGGALLAFPVLGRLLGGAPGRDADGGNLPGLRRGGADSDPGLPGAGLGLPGALGDHWTRARMSSRASSGWRALFRAKATVLAAFSMTVSTSRGVTIMGSGEVSRG